MAKTRAEQRLDYTFDKGGSTPGRKHKLRPGDGCYWITDDGSYQYGFVTDWAVKGKRGHYQVVRMTGGHVGATPYGRPKWIISYKLTPTGRWWRGLLYQFRANLKLAERGCSCNCCVHEAIPRSLLDKEGRIRDYE